VARLDVVSAAPLSVGVAGRSPQLEQGEAP
jgi:hypothetical protein